MKGTSQINLRLDNETISGLRKLAHYLSLKENRDLTYLDLIRRAISYNYGDIIKNTCAEISEEDKIINKYKQNIIGGE